MIEAINNYKDALQAHLEAQRMEAVAKDKLQKTRHAVNLAWEELNAMKRQILEDNLRDL